MKAIYEQDDGAKIIYDKTENDIIYGHIVRDGKEYPSKPVEQLLARGYWKPIEA